MSVGDRPPVSARLLGYTGLVMHPRSLHLGTSPVFATLLAAAAWGLALLVALRWGALDLSWGELARVLRDPRGASEMAPIVWDIRLPRAVLAGLCGFGLAVAGAAWQGLLRNALADPYLVGVSAGGALGAAAALLWPPLAAWGVPLPAFAGSLGAAALVYRLAWRTGGPSVERLLLTGVAVSAGLSALLSLALLSRAETVATLQFWLSGGLSGRGWEHVALAAPYVACGSLALWIWAPRLDALQFGDATAHSLGVSVSSARATLIAAAALVTAAVVSVSGMIGFVGLLVPHAARRWVGPGGRGLLPVAGCLGAALVTVADAASRTLWAPSEIPVGILMALIGAPFFLALLARRSA